MSNLLLRGFTVGVLVFAVLFHWHEKSCLFLLSFEVLEPFNGEFMRFIERIIERS